MHELRKSFAPRADYLEQNSRCGSCTFLCDCVSVGAHLLAFYFYARITYSLITRKWVQRADTDGGRITYNSSLDQ